MFTEKDFEDIRPYRDDEINAALQRIVAVPEFGKILGFLFPDKDGSNILATLNQIQSAIEFQKQFMHPLVNSIVQKTSNGLTTSGFENLIPGTPYLFVANHRDIVLDSAILQVVLLDFGHQTSEITFGSNLMINQFIIDLGKVNRMFKVYRGGNRMELFRNSKLLSAYIRHTITSKHTSAWIAQRNGRTKDGNDKTESGLLKMFNISGNSDFDESFAALNIVPLAVSYEYEPCCDLKVKEMGFAAKGLPYAKEPNEDFLSILSGITKPKGRIHLAAGTPINELLPQTGGTDVYNDRINKLAALMDAEVYKHYKLRPTNYIASDILNNCDRYTSYYTHEEKSGFLTYMQQQLSALSNPEPLHMDLFLKIYATPVANAEVNML